jgi:hypothetical protein
MFSFATKFLYVRNSCDSKIADNYFPNSIKRLGFLKESDRVRREGLTFYNLYNLDKRPSAPRGAGPRRQDGQSNVQLQEDLDLNLTFSVW